MAVSRIPSDVKFIWTIENVTMAKNLPNDGVIDSPIFLSRANGQEMRWFIRIQVGKFTSQFCNIHIFLMSAPGTEVPFFGYHVVTMDTVGESAHCQALNPQRVSCIEENVAILKYSRENYIPPLDKFPLITDTLKITCYFGGDGEEKKIYSDSQCLSNISDLQKLSDDFSSLFKSGLLSDVHIITTDEVFKVHKIILFARCPTLLQGMKKDESDASAVDTINVDIEAPVLKALLLYFYSGKLSLGDSNLLASLYNAVSNFEVDTLLRDIGFVPKVVSARTVIKATRECLIWPIKNFTSLKRGERVYSPVTDIGSESFQLSLICAEDSKFSDHVKIFIHRISKFITEELLCMCTISVIGVNRKEALLHSHSCKYTKKRDWTFPTIITKNWLYRDKEHNLPQDTLTVRCDLVISLGDVTVAFDGSVCKPAGPEQELINLRRLSQDLWDVHFQMLSKCAFHTDVNIKLRKDEIRAHKAILSARSPELARRFDPKIYEHPTEELDLSYAEVITVRSLISYAYAGRIDEFTTIDKSYDDLKAIYTLADRYEMLSLREKCSSALKACHKVDQSVELLRLANTYKDIGLKDYIMECIADNSLNILRTNEWKKLLRQNSELVSEVFVCLADMYKSTIAEAIPLL